MKSFFHRHQPPATPRAAVIAGIGSFIAIAVLAFLTDHQYFAMLMAPFGATSVLLFAAPAAPLSQPINVVAGHVLAGAIGLVTSLLLPAGFWVSGIAVGIAVAAMVAFRVVHPPAGATALVAAGKTWVFLAFPILTGSLALVALATLYHRANGTAYPAQMK